MSPQGMQSPSAGLSGLALLLLRKEMNESTSLHSQHNHTWESQPLAMGQAFSKISKSLFWG